MRRFLKFAAIPALLAATTALAAPAPATLAASDGLTETANTTYELVPDAGLIHVSISLSLANSKPDLVEQVPCGAGATCTNTVRYFWNSASIWVESGAAKLTATSNAGAVSQSVTESTPYYRIIKLGFANVYNGQTRTVQVSYDIPGGAPRSNSSTRAGKAYASFCVGGNGRDGGSVSAVIPAGYEVEIGSGDTMTSSSANGKQTFASGTLQDPVKFYSCLTATNASALATSSLSAGGQPFQFQAWPEDKQWIAQVQGDVSSEFTKLQQLIGLPVSGSGAITITEEAPSVLGDYAGFYNPKTRIAGIGEDADSSLVAHELSHIWFNDGLFAEKWMDEGFAGYAEKVAGAGKYQPCKQPGAYPGDGPPDLTDWKFLGPKASTQEQAVVDFQYAAACYLVATAGNAIGDDRMRDVLTAGAAGEIAYAGAGSPEKVGSAGPIDAKHLLDLLDERGMVPAGVGDLDTLQKLFAAYGVITDTQALADRSSARETYHELVAAAGDWKLPLAIREPMSEWNFDAAQSAMTTGRQILDLRNRVTSLVSGATLAGTAAQKAFEDAANASDLGAALTEMQKEADAAAKVAQARRAYDAGRSPIETVGLLGTDLGGPMTAATNAVKQAKPDDARTNADKVLGAVNGATNAGLVRIAAAVIAALLVFGGLAFLVLRRRRRGPAVALATATDGSLPPGALAPPADPNAPITDANGQVTADGPPADPGAPIPAAGDAAQATNAETPSDTGPGPNDATAVWTAPSAGDTAPATGDTAPANPSAAAAGTATGANPDRP